MLLLLFFVGDLVAEVGKLYAVNIHVRIFPPLLLNMRHFNAFCWSMQTQFFLVFHFHFYTTLLNLSSIGIFVLAVRTENPFMAQTSTIADTEIFIPFWKCTWLISTVFNIKGIKPRKCTLLLPPCRQRKIRDQTYKPGKASERQLGGNVKMSFSLDLFPPQSFQRVTMS